MFRIYVKEGCPHCHAAMQWFKEHPNVPSDFVAAGNDPVLNAGLKAWGDEVPLVVCFATNKIIKGFRPEEFQRHVDIFLERNSPSSFTVVDSESNGTGQAAKPVEEVALAAGVN